MVSDAHGFDLALLVRINRQPAADQSLMIRAVFGIPYQICCCGVSLAADIVRKPQNGVKAGILVDLEDMPVQTSDEQNSRAGLKQIALQRTYEFECSERSAVSYRLMDFGLAISHLDRGSVPATQPIPFGNPQQSMQLPASLKSMRSDGESSRRDNKRQPDFPAYSHIDTPCYLSIGTIVMPGADANNGKYAEQESASPPSDAAGSQEK